MMHQRLLIACLSLLIADSALAELKSDYQLNYEFTAFPEESAVNSNNTQRVNSSVSLLGEFFSSWDDGSQSLSVKPYYRYDENDNERSHGDVRELIWNKVADNYELKIGVGKVFWGVTESAHLVDIVNQTDSVEGIDGEAKLGQPMVQVLLERDWGNLDLFVLPYHRERTHVGGDGRLGLGLAYSNALYESSNAEKNIDFAARYYAYVDELEYGFSVFHGTSREASLGFDGVNSSLLPYYATITQLGIELQYLLEGWAWKFEGIHRDGMPGNDIASAFGNLPVINGANLLIAGDESYYATALGFEYTQVGILDSRVDLGWVVEHLYDSRQDKAGAGAFEHDVLFATRWAANDMASSTLLAGVLYDYEHTDYSLSLEGNTRLFDIVTLAVEARVFAPSQANPQYQIRDEDFVKLTLGYYF